MRPEPQANGSVVAEERCAFSVAYHACGLPLEHDGPHEAWVWFCERHHSWLCQAGQGKCQAERFGVCDMAACGMPTVYCLVGGAGDLWFCERHRPAHVAPTTALTTRGA